MRTQKSAVDILDVLRVIFERRVIFQRAHVRCDARLKIYRVHFDESLDRFEPFEIQYSSCAHTESALSPSLFLSLSFNR
jgi:hypothetical protein